MKKIKSLILAASVLLSLFVPVTVNAGNTKFGIADDGWIGYISNGSGKPEDLEAVAERVSDVTHSGRFAGHVKTHFYMAANTYVDLRYVIPGDLLKPETTYMFRYWVKAKDAGIHRLKNIIGGAERDWELFAWYETSDWKEKSASFKTSKSGGDVEIVFRSEGCEQEWHDDKPVEVWIDDLAIYEMVDGVEIGENIIKDRNPGFETVDTVPPSELGNLSAKVSNSAATFTWTEPEDDDFFKVKIYDITGGSKKLLKEVNKGTVSYVARKLKNETEYEYLFTTVDTMDNESEGTKIKFIPVIPPAKPDVAADDENDVIIGGNSAMEIKVDAGEWTDYTDGLVFEGNHVVLVRVKANGYYPSSANTLLIFKKPQTEFEKLPIQLTKADFYKNSFKFAGVVKGGVNADVTAVIRKGESFSDYIYAKQLVTDEEGRFEAEAVLADMRGDADMSGKYTFAVNSSDGIKSQEITINFASEALRREAIEYLNSSKNLRDTVEKYESTFNTLGIDVTEYLESADKQKYIDDVVENILPIEKTDDALQSIFKEAQFVYDINNADGVSEIQSLILASPYEFKYKESTVFEMLSEDEAVAQRAMEIVGMTDDYKSAKEIEDEFEFGCALYHVCHAQYSTLKKILEDNEDELGIKDESEYDDYLDEADNTAVNKYFVRNAYPDKLKSMDELLSLLEKSAEKADEKSSGGGGGGGGSSISPSKGLSNVGAITSTPVADNGNTNTQPVKPSSVFTDLAGSEWAENAITALYKKGIVSGSGDGRFYPGNNITREEFVKLVIEAFNIEANDENTDFADAEKGAWYCKYINAAVNNGIVTGKDNGTFGIGENITRQDMAVILYRTAKALGYEFGATKEVSFTDSENISDYAVEAVMALSNAGIINGMENGVFAPLENATRAQGAQIIYNVLSERGDV